MSSDGKDHTAETATYDLNDPMDAVLFLQAQSGSVINLSPWGRTTIINADHYAIAVKTIAKSVLRLQEATSG